MENEFQNSPQALEQNKNAELESIPHEVISAQTNKNPGQTDLSKGEKIKEYEKMFKILNKQRDYEKIKSLALELKEFDPANAMAEKWFKKAENKLSPKSFLTWLFSHFKKSEPSKDKITLNKLIPESKVEFKNSPSNPAFTASSPSITSQILPQSAALMAMAPPSVPSSPAGKVKSPQGNTFTKMFGAPENNPKNASSIIDRIVAKTEKKEKPKIVQPQLPSLKPKNQKKEFNLLAFSKLFMNFTAVFIFLTGTFLYVEFIDQDNSFLSLVGVQQNTGSQLHAASEKLSEVKRQVAILETDIKKFKTGYEDSSLATIQSIVNQRINWPDIFFKINEVTNSVYELNDFFKYVEYENYAFDAEKQTIRITGHLSDPQGRNLTKLVELEEAFMYYPKDKNNPDDPTKPFFQGFKELTTLSKSIDKGTGRYVSDFQLSFALNPS